MYPRRKGSNSGPPGMCSSLHTCYSTWTWQIRAMLQQKKANLIFRNFAMLYADTVQVQAWWCGYVCGCDVLSCRCDATVKRIWCAILWMWADVMWIFVNVRVWNVLLLMWCALLWMWADLMCILWMCEDVMCTFADVMCIFRGWERMWCAFFVDVRGCDVPFFEFKLMWFDVHFCGCERMWCAFL